MDILAVFEQVRTLLQQQGRVSYRILQRQFGLDADALEALRDELIEGQRVAVDEDGKVLVWVGKSSPESHVQERHKAKMSNPQPPNPQFGSPAWFRCEDD